MTEHKFVYTVSGVELTEAQKTKISDGIAAAVSAALVGAAPKALKSGALNIGNIHGGIWIDVAAVANEKVGDLVKRATAI